MGIDIAAQRRFLVSRPKWLHTEDGPGDWNCNGGSHTPKMSHTTNSHGKDLHREIQVLPLVRGRFTPRKQEAARVEPPNFQTLTLCIVRAVFRTPSLKPMPCCTPCLAPGGDEHEEARPRGSRRHQGRLPPK